MKSNKSALELIIGSTRLKVLFGLLLLAWIFGGIGIGMVIQGLILFMQSLAVLFGFRSILAGILGFDESLLQLFSARSYPRENITLILFCLINILFIAGGIAILKGAGLCNQNLLCILWGLL